MSIQPKPNMFVIAHSVCGLGWDLRVVLLADPSFWAQQIRRATVVGHCALQEANFNVFSQAGEQAGMEERGCSISFGVRFTRARQTPKTGWNVQNCRSACLVAVLGIECSTQPDLVQLYSAPIERIWVNFQAQELQRGFRGLKLKSCVNLCNLRGG